MNKTKIIGEIGINHNGDIDIAKQLILVAKAAGCDYVKFQKRNPDICVPEEQKSKMRQTPWGEITYLEYKWKTEFGEAEYDEIDRFCKEIGINWFASVWDKTSVDFMVKYKTDLGVTMKIPSALITDTELCEYAKEKSDYLMISTGMSTEEEIKICIDSCNPEVVMHTNSTYPCPVNELNLNYITWLKNEYPEKEIGYSGHEYGLVTTFATIPMGVTWVERHITLDRTMYGSDQAASLELSGMKHLSNSITKILAALGKPSLGKIIDDEIPIAKKLRAHIKI